MAFANSTKFQYDVNVNVVGLQQLLADLRKFDRDLYKEVEQQLKATAQPVAAAVGAAFPQKTPLEYWHARGRRGEARLPGYDPGSVRAGMKAIVYSGNKFIGKNVGILRIQQMNAGGAVYDSAGGKMANPKGDNFIRNLDKHLRVKSTGGKSRSRVVFPTAKRFLPYIEGLVAKAIDAQQDRIRANIIQGAASKGFRR